MITASDFTVGMDVQHKGNTKRRGVVIGNQLSDGDQVVAVEWADGQLAKVNVNDIQKCLSMEEEFALMRTQVNEKLQAAADLISEATNLAKAHGKNLLSNDDEDYEPLFDTDAIEGAMDDAGWNTSSWHC
jgi:hypothetical protein